MIGFTLRRLVLLTMAAAAISAPAWGSTLYGITFGDQLIAINTSTGAGTVVGTLSTSMLSFDLGVYSSNLLGYDQNANLFREINPANAQTITSFSVGAGTLAGEGSFVVKSDGTGFLDATAAGGGKGFYSFNLIAGTSSLIPTASGIAFDGMALGSGGALLGLDQGGDRLYSIDATTGAVTSIGSTGISPSLNYFLGGLAFDQNGNLYAALSNSVADVNNLYSINPTTGAATLIGPIGSGLTVSGIAFYPASTVPEPASAWLTGVGALAGCMAFRRTDASRPKTLQRTSTLA